MSERTRLHYPTVYVVHTEDKNRYKSVPDYTVYVGETNSDTKSHLAAFEDGFKCSGGLEGFCGPFTVGCFFRVAVCYC